MITHPTPAERLLSMLEDGRAVESLSANEVREDLTTLGVNPARSIAFAKSLARGGGSPGGRLMGALLAGEEEDEEIARIESADIEEVRAQVHHGAAAAIAAEARRKAGIDDNVVGLDAKRRKRRRRLIVWGGPLAGIAASLLVVVVFMGNVFLSPERRDIADNIGARQVEAPRPNMPDPAMEGYTKPGPDKSLTDQMLALDVPPELESAERSKEKSFADSDAGTPSGEMLALNEPAPPPATAEKKGDAPAKPAARLRKQEENLPPPVMSAPSQAPAAADDKVAAAPAAPVGVLGGSAEAESDGAADNERRGIVPRSTGSADLPGVVVPPSGDLAGEAFETETAALPPVDKDAGAGLVRNVEISEIAAVLVVDPSRASLQIQSQILPTGGLADRVEEARRLAGGRPVIALYTIATGPARWDFAQVPLQTGLTQQMAAPSPLIGLLGVEASEYDFIALPAE